ncbi:MAG: glycosyltransferase family 39 protein [Chlamydiales bacterium]|nr:glycosyltransferase family 39 protein [Chlamydiales bacterium]
MSSVFTIENRYQRNYFYLLLFLLIFKAALALVLIGTYDVHLAPDEAQYWTWSQQLDWGYFSKPPAIAWQIFLTTALFGNNEFGVRFGAVLISFFLPLITYATAKYAHFSARTAFWTGIVMAFSPLGIFLSFMATTDGGMMLFLTLGICSIVRGLNEDEGPNYAVTGLWIMLSALYKWTAFVLWPVTLFFMLFYGRLRKWGFFFGIAISLLAFIPSLYWNLTHDFATFKHVGHTITKKIGHHGNFLDFFFAQIGLFSPIFWGMLFCSYFFMKSRSVIYCAAYPFLFLIYFIAAFFKQIQPNWGAFLYPAAALPVAWFGVERLRTGKIWLQLGTWLSIVFSVVAIAIPFIQSRNLLPIPYKVSPFRQNVGWSHLGPALSKSGYDPQTDFLFGDKYQTASLLSFYGPEKKRAYFFNLNGDRKNQFSYWPQIEEKGKTGFFVVIENVKEEALNWYKEHYEQRLKPYFASVEHMGVTPLFVSCGEAVKHAIIFRCTDFSGSHPQDPEKY